MEIKLVDFFDLYGDGTLVLRTIVDTPEKDVLYAWDVEKEKTRIHKGEFSPKPFMAVKVTEPGSYLIRSYVFDQMKKEKIIYEKYCELDRNTSPQLIAGKKRNAAGQTEPDTTTKPVVTHIAGPFWMANVAEQYPEDATFSWYLYTDGSTKPFEKQGFSRDQEFVYRFRNPGNYRVKLTVLVKGEKLVSMSDSFHVSLDSDPS